MKKVIIASHNPVKISAAEIAFSKAFPDEVFEFVGVDVDSGVPDQPVNDETKKGAHNRIKHAQELEEDADFWVAMEGGIQEVGKDYYACAHLVIRGKQGIEGESSAALFRLPPKVSELIRDGMELGSASDKVFNESNLKQKAGTVGILTNNIITRTDYYVHPMLMALIPFMNKEIY